MFVWFGHSSKPNIPTILLCLAMSPTVYQTLFATSYNLLTYSKKPCVKIWTEKQKGKQKCLLTSRGNKQFSVYTLAKNQAATTHGSFSSPFHSFSNLNSCCGKSGGIVTTWFWQEFPNLKTFYYLSHTHDWSFCMEEVAETRQEARTALPVVVKAHSNHLTPQLIGCLSDAEKTCVI